MPSTTRKPIPRKYKECKACPNDIPNYGKCKIKFDNFYYRKEKTTIAAIARKRFGNEYRDLA